MKIQLHENDGCFSLVLDAENMTEAALLVRFGMNRTDKINSAASEAFQDGRFSSFLVFAKNKRAGSQIPKLK